MKNICVLLAGGNGNRLGGDLPKQFIKIAGKTIIEHSIDIFEKSEQIHEIVIVINPMYVQQIENIVIKNQYKKVKKILQGGKERSDSSLAAIHAYEHEPNSDHFNLIFHDAVRPFVSLSIIENVVSAMKKYNAVDVAIPATDTIIEVDKNDFIVNVPKRSSLRQGQTPQAFKLSTIRDAYKLAANDSAFTTTDDCGVVLKYLPQEKVFVVEGSQSNIKVTYELDLFIADKLFQLKHLDFNSRELLENQKETLKSKVIVVFGGSYGIGKDIVNIFNKIGAKVYSFSRTHNNVNVKDKTAVNKALESVYKENKKIDYVINTAAILNKEPLMNLDTESIQEITQVNYIGMINVATESFKYLKETKGQLLLFTSSSYTRGRSSYSLYSSTKAAVVNFTQAIAEEWKDFGIKINCINPERTQTPMRIKNFGIEPEDSLLKSREVAKVSIRTLLSDFTGQIIYVRK
ncbi:2-C-methyl-D-erythritol 4-phosphate cytidylyltransferase [Ancylomarina euxinus]|uniref:2-C-methyl-D-erythritol 4-phosphate cytidylyltransferase n=1 Tax=Ancylomarina euxinus TaxID=2283627 RepID=A0A425Y1Q4_9BACT|nr:2-C-methyl-D-erythritol 4-phosphate cytidylyltransferase [Ancylomarina euxinus]MCZ4695109.1 2-C-methyl-D-erythritol 4-phosphate cytidylyltransferase [Ancylomarina euxinus]MUP14955.1 2-C-methyl-D-erythritol 4-phosphate cytidylyltransferase [Ancylomarina euxinus]RRG21847.1 2-C-methyl-D-erythritol 4-phosphate cytidylyltransferase [Ancylomarina euxinus]